VYDKSLLSTVHLRRAGTPEEIARVIVFLCSDEASYIMGTTVTPDGGSPWRYEYIRRRSGPSPSSAAERNRWMAN